VDVSYTTQDSTDVRLPSWAEDGSTNGAGIIGSRVYSATLDADEDTMAGGVVGTTSNADLPTYVEQDPDIDGTETRLQVSGQIDYNNSQDQTHTVRTAGYLTDCTISVSINSTTAGAVNVDSIREHVANAAGITAVASKTMTAEEYLANKISVLSLPFYEPTVTILSGPGITLPDWLPAWALYAALGGLLLFIILLIVILRIAKKRKQKKLAAAALAAGADAADVDAMLAAAAAEAATGADVMSMQTEHSMALRKDIRRFADENPELAAQMIKSWLRGGDDNG
jgi:flagellar M-ring protein FliF